ncbi:sodium-dependent bicarbonate transport family permease [Oceanospirillum sediminis]|uniref:Sodium-dependent bicarbonate transport family permease n=1 Tax=Oceanospirillum sediminis TaxID=2760088 RepID=A0A839IYG5_9GAMM|nr:sodium-dependent bicarbonate transport family permease [Oceanospirillum sediminis]MBB1489417.1 sodium-dependent bicarbonate transport family permease [Oceanospirillum sediminis]
MQLDIVVAFFILGMFSTLVGAKIDFPKGLYQSCVLFLLLAIGLKGGYALSNFSGADLLPQSLAVLGFGFALPLIAFPILYWVGGWSRVDAASTAAHYGSVSVGTYAVGVAVLEAQGIDYEPYFPLFVALLEAPAIAVGLLLAIQNRSQLRVKELAHEVLFNQGVLLLMGGLIIGFWAGDRVQSVLPFFGTLFHGVLALFLLEMGRKAASRLHELKSQSAFLVSFGVVMPLIGALTGGILGYLLGLSTGGVTLMAVLGGSASYIAVPAALAVSLPQANLSLSLTASLAITFPFNVIVGIPLYLGLTRYWSG